MTTEEIASSMERTMLIIGANERSSIDGIGRNNNIQL
jgi:hypothetical protein